LTQKKATETTDKSPKRKPVPQGRRGNKPPPLRSGLVILDFDVFSVCSVFSVAKVKKMKKAFTLIELMVAVGILAIILSFSGVVFNASIETYRVATANSEIMRKFRAITDQLDADFEGLRKDGEIFVAWVARPKSGYDPCDPSSYERFDRIMFFAGGDFQSYGTSPMVRGNIARICYMLATNAGLKAEDQVPSERILARTQHILTADSSVPLFFDPNSLDDTHWYRWNNLYEYDKIDTTSLEQWKKMPFARKRNALSVITGIRVDVPDIDESVWGAHVDPADPNSIHMLLCEGVGEFSVQGWYDAQGRWLPEVDPGADGDVMDSDFFLGTPDAIPGVLYPYRISVPSPVPPDETYGHVNINNLWFPQTSVSEVNFNNIPGLGRALKFTFTLFDSKGIIEQGRTFTHIVYLDKEY